MLNVGGIRRARVQSGGMVMESQQAALAQPRRIVPFTCTEEDPSERLLTAQPLHSGLETGEKINQRYRAAHRFPHAFSCPARVT